MAEGNCQIETYKITVSGLIKISIVTLPSFLDLIVDRMIVPITHTYVLVRRSPSRSVKMDEGVIELFSHLVD